MTIDRIEHYREKGIGRGSSQGKKGGREDLRGKIILFVSLCAFALLLGLAFFSQDGILEVARLKGKMARLSAEIKEIGLQNLKLAGEIELLKKDYRYIEKIAREELGMAKADELIYIFEEQPPKKSGMKSD